MVCVRAACGLVTLRVNEKQVELRDAKAFLIGSSSGQQRRVERRNTNGNFLAVLPVAFLYVFYLSWPRNFWRREKTKDALRPHSSVHSLAGNVHLSCGLV